MKVIENEMLSVDEFAKMANISLPHVRQLLRENKIKGVKVGKTWRINRGEVNNYLGITTDIKSMERELIIVELKAKLNATESQLENFKNIVGVLANMVGV
ncbi:MAG: excisionase family DNA-binding protein [Clostridium sp.]|uniref:excisionase family DNA-binding protein n=1 Tax=Clostridium TaxID=1485 RepID=UPI002902A205|nr:excisionase family DNA-binding protein [Clostridium sp.]MDU1280016.1 excisionase family DNA-binding protein [Clostridium sp.]MDU7089081.1 excisionase family DNA-binding protein [Clostridium sp.]